MTQPTIDTTQALVLQRLVALLRTELSLHSRYCYLTDNPLDLPDLPVGGNYAVSVAAGDGQFDVDGQVGGGEDQLYEQGSAVITWYVRMDLDTPDHAEQLLVSANRGLVTIKRAILKAVCGKMLADLAGSDLLRQHLYAIHAYRANYRRDAGIAWMAIEVGLDFCWDLS